MNTTQIKELTTRIIEALENRADKERYKTVSHCVTGIWREVEDHSQIEDALGMFDEYIERALKVRHPREQQKADEAMLKACDIIRTAVGRIEKDAEK